MWDIVRVSPQGHRSVSVSQHFILQAPQCPCSMRKRFSRHHCCRGRSIPGCRIVWSHTRWELTTWADFQLCLHRLLMSTGCKSSHNSFLDVSRSEYFTISNCVFNFSFLSLVLYEILGGPKFILGGAALPWMPHNRKIVIPKTSTLAYLIAVLISTF